MEAAVTGEQTDLWRMDYDIPMTYDLPELPEDAALEGDGEDSSAEARVRSRSRKKRQRGETTSQGRRKSAATTPMGN
jgi:hypothetical protein